MPDLPTITITDEQLTVVLAAFQDKYGTITTQDTVKAFKQEMANFVVNTVLEYKRKKIMEAATADAEAQVADLRSKILPIVQGLL